MKNFTALIFLLFSSLLFSQSHNLQQVVKNWPSNRDTTGIHWTVYNLEDAETKVLNEASVGSGTNYVPSLHLIVWNANVGNFPGSPPWLPGDSIIGFGSWDSAYANDPVYYNFNHNHTGFYWVFSDTLTTEEPQFWQPDDTLRILSKPIVSLQDTTSAVDTIIIKIPNPKETRRLDQTIYDIMGYKLYVAEHIGTPANLTEKVTYIPCQGGYGDTTVYFDVEDEHTGSPIFYAYKVIFRPDTTITESNDIGYTTPYSSMNSDTLNLNWAGVAPGYMTKYLSSNSDSVHISWVADIKQPKPSFRESCSIKLEIRPNPFTTKTVIEFKGSGVQKFNSQLSNSLTQKLLIYDVSGRLVRQLTIDNSQLTNIFWDGTDSDGNVVSEGVYFCQVKMPSENITGKFVKIR